MAPPNAQARKLLAHRMKKLKKMDHRADRTVTYHKKSFNFDCSIISLALIGALLICAPIATSSPKHQADSLTNKQDIKPPEVRDGKLLSSANRLISDQPTSYFREDSLNSHFDQNVTFDQYIGYAMRALALVAGYDNDLHRYDSNQDLMNSFKRDDSQSKNLIAAHSTLPLNELIEINHLQCGLQLDALIKESRQLLADSRTFSNSKQLNLIEFIDSFGAPSAQLMKGNSMWLGSYKQCQSSKLAFGPASAASSTAGSRYCVANFRSPQWPNEEHAPSSRLGNLSLKLGICLPESCNSLSFERHREQIETLAKLVRFNQVPFSSYKLTNLFCLPDESSPLRRMSHSALLFMVVCTIWFSLIIYFSFRHEYLRMSYLLSTNSPNIDKFNSDASNTMKIFAFRLSWSKLFDDTATRSINANSTATTMTTSAMHTVQRGQAVAAAKPAFATANIIEALRCQPAAPKAGPMDVLKVSLDQTTHCNEVGAKEKPPAALVIGLNHCKQTTRSTQTQPSWVDLSAIDGIKVLSMIWLIGGHTLLFFIRVISNGRDFWSVLRDARFLTIMAGIFPVDTFFTITGILTAYLKFQKDDGRAMRRPSYWPEVFVHRYLRFMPMYLAVFWYTRDVSQYIGSGPLWDYATADTSLRSMCKQESFATPLLFQANFKSIDQHCVKPAWYLANDYQFLLITPFFMALIMKSTILGYSVIGMSVAISLVLQFLTVFYSIEMPDFEALVNFKPMFGTYVLKNLWKLYVLPYNRIPPYLIGLVTGHLLYRLNKANQSAKLAKFAPISTQPDAWLAKDSLSNGSQSGTNEHGNDKDRWTLKLVIVALSQYFCVQIWTPLALLISIIYLPLITKVLTLEGSQAKVGTSCIIALMRFVWSMSIARLIFICATQSHAKTKFVGSSSFVVRFLSSAKWKPWSKIGLSALLIQWEIISYLIQTQTSAPDITISLLMAFVLICIVATYSLALIIYLTIEYPLSQVEQIYITPTIFGKR